MHRRKSCITCKKILVSKKPNAIKITVIRCKACNEPYHLKCCDPSWLVEKETVCCCAIEICRQFTAYALLGDLTGHLGERTCEVIDRSSASCDNSIALSNSRGSSKRPASPPSPTTAQPAKISCHAASVYTQFPIANVDFSITAASSVADFNTLIAAHDSMAENAGMEVDAAGYTNAPAWFMTYISQFQNFVSEYRNDKVKLCEDMKALSDRLEAVESTHGIQLLQHTSQLATLTSTVEAISGQKQAGQKQTGGNCEVIVMGISTAVTLSDPEIMKKVLEAIQLPLVHQHIVTTRPWSPASATAPTPSTSAAADPVASLTTSETTAPVAINSISATVDSVVNITRSFVCKFVSEDVRDTVMAHSKMLGDFDSQSLFGIGGNLHVFLRPLLPKPVFELWRKACTKAKVLNYMRPYIQHQEIFMRESRSGAPFKISSESDLASLLPRAPNN